jgi:hypothetical protein
MSVLLKGAPRRRSVLRGLIGGGAVTVALPFLDCFLNDHGTALASGAPMPVRFGTWFWGLGYSPGFGISTTSRNLDLLLEAKALERHIKQMNYFSGFNAPLDGAANMVHYSGIVVARTGTAPVTQQDIPAPTIDVLIGDVIGKGTRFKSLDVATSGGPRASLSARSTGSRNAAETSPVALYSRVFGAEFADPNKADFKPDPEIMIRKSVLSGVEEDSKRLIPTLGSADRARMDEYFTSVRELEQQLDLQLQKPAPNEACKIPERPAEQNASGEGVGLDPGTEITAVRASNLAFAKLIAMAMACNQTKVFTMTFSSGSSALRRQGLGTYHHTLSHEEPIDSRLGYQAQVSWFNQQTMQGCADFVDMFASIREGAGTLLDNTLIMAHSDTNDARVHALDAIPVITFGKAGGRVRTGSHIAGGGDPITRVGFTAMQAMGVPISTWGTKSNETSKPLKDVMA